MPAFLYQPAAGLHGLALAILILAFALMVVSSRNSRLRRIVRHPQLTGVTLWGLAHLLLNGDSRFFDIESPGMNLDGCALHQALLDAYNKVQRKKIEASL